MGEYYSVLAIEIIDQNRPDINLERTLIQIDCKRSDTKEQIRLFIDSREFFNLIAKNADANQSGK